MHKVAYIPVLLLVASCAVTDPSTGRPAVERSTADPTGSGQLLTLHEEVSGGTSILPRGVDSLWAVLPAVYEQLGIEPRHVNATNKIVGNRNFAANRALGGIPLSRMVRCGLTSLGLPRENSSRITLSVMTSLSAESETRTRVQTRVEASARDAGTGSGPVECTSTGTLETMISEGLEQRLAG